MAQPPGPRRQARASTQYQRQLENFTASSSASASSSSFASPSAARLASNPVGTPTEGKVAIPRLPGVAQQSSAPDRNRVNHACEPCRKRKSKCDGVHPICSRCKNQGVDCIYADGKRERLKRSVFSLSPIHFRYFSFNTSIPHTMRLRLFILDILSKKRGLEMYKRWP